MKQKKKLISNKMKGKILSDEHKLKKVMVY